MTFTNKAEGGKKITVTIVTMSAPLRMTCKQTWPFHGRGYNNTHGYRATLMLKHCETGEQIKKGTSDEI